MERIRIDDEPELKIEEAMQVKGRGAKKDTVKGPVLDHDFQSRVAAQSMGIAETLSVFARSWSAHA
jgi:hypothetical protein